MNERKEKIEKALKLFEFMEQFMIAIALIKKFHLDRKLDN